MKCSSLACAAMAFATPGAPHAAEAFGVVSTDGTIACVALRHLARPLPLRARVVVPDSPERVLAGTVVSPLPRPCPAPAHAGLEGPFYLFRPTARSDLSPGMLGIAYAGHRQDLRFRSCTSAEGIHLTVWAGAPVRPERLWHGYYYLGYDVEPTCSEKETE